MDSLSLKQAQKLNINAFGVGDGTLNLILNTGHHSKLGRWESQHVQYSKRKKGDRISKVILYEYQNQLDGIEFVSKQGRCVLKHGFTECILMMTHVDSSYSVKVVNVEDNEKVIGVTAKSVVGVGELANKYSPLAKFL